MSSITISGDTSGAVSIAAPAIAGTNTMTLVAGTGSLAPKVLSTAVSASGSSVSFINIPSWVTRITIMFNGVSLNGTNSTIVSLGTSGGIVSSGYSGGMMYTTASGVLGTSSPTSGFGIYTAVAAAAHTGHMIITNITGTTWVSSHTLASSNPLSLVGGSSVDIAGTLTQLQIAPSGANSFDAGTINISYE